MKHLAWAFAVYVAFGLGYMVAENKYYDMTKGELDATEESRKESAVMKATAKAALDLAELIIKLSRIS